MTSPPSIRKFAQGRKPTIAEIEAWRQTALSIRNNGHAKKVVALCDKIYVLEVENRRLSGLLEKVESMSSTQEDTYEDGGTLRQINEIAAERSKNA